MRVGVVGAGGRMGREVCRAVAAADGLELVAGVDPQCAGDDLGLLSGGDATGVLVGDQLESLTRAAVEVVVDFTRVDAARTSLAWCARAGIHAIVGTTGFTEEDMADIGRWFGGPEADAPNCIVAPNFAIGAVLMMRFAELAAPWFEGAEIIELHHDAKRDAPSGTAMRTAVRMQQARQRAGREAFPDDRTSTVTGVGARGAEGPGRIRVHSVRLPGLVAHQEVIFGSAGQGLTIRHDSYDRGSFMDGVVLAVTCVGDRPGLTVGLESLLDL